MPDLQLFSTQAGLFKSCLSSSLLKLTQRAFKLDEQSDRLTDKDLSRCEGLLGALPAEEIAQRFEQRLERARILAAGALIIQAVMQYVHLSEVRVSSQGSTSM